MRHGRLLFPLAVVLGFLVAANTASAAKKPHVSPQKMGVTLVGKAIVTAPATAVATATGVARVVASSCKTVTFSAYYRNVVGWNLWGYFHRITWCWSGSTITSVSRRVWAEVYIPGWSFKQNVGFQSSGGRGHAYYSAWTQGHFCLVEFFSCVVNRYPWIDVTVYAGGRYTHGVGG